MGLYVTLLITVFVTIVLEGLYIANGKEAL